MKWHSHKLATGAILYTVTGNLIITGLGVLGSTFPDFIEGKPPKQGTPAYQQWRKHHRQGSHWLLPYLLITFFGFYYLHTFGIVAISWGKLLDMLTHWSSNIDVLLIHFISCFTLGCVLHILEDSICGRVPMLMRSPRLGLRLFRVGSVWEYLLVFPASVFLIIWRVAYEYNWLEYLKVPAWPNWFF